MLHHVDTCCHVTIDGHAYPAQVGEAPELAARQGVTLLGFLREGPANLYTHPHRRMAAEGIDAQEVL